MKIIIVYVISTFMCRKKLLVVASVPDILLLKQFVHSAIILPSLFLIILKKVPSKIHGIFSPISHSVAIFKQSSRSTSTILLHSLHSTRGARKILFGFCHDDTHRRPTNLVWRMNQSVVVYLFLLLFTLLWLRNSSNVKSLI
jgi:hypothetical protein